MTATLATNTIVPPTAQASGFAGKDFLNTTDFSQEEFVELVERALSLKREGYGRQLLAGHGAGHGLLQPLAAHQDLPGLGRGPAGRHHH